MIFAMSPSWIFVFFAIFVLFAIFVFQIFVFLDSGPANHLRHGSGGQEAGHYVRPSRYGKSGGGTRRFVACSNA
jgi:hypothetical protein